MDISNLVDHPNQEFTRQMLPGIQKIVAAMGLADDIESWLRVIDHILDVHKVYCQSCARRMHTSSLDDIKHEKASLIPMTPHHDSSDQFKEKISQDGGFYKELDSEPVDLSLLCQTAFSSEIPLNISSDPHDACEEDSTDNDTIIYENDYVYEVLKEGPTCEPESIKTIRVNKDGKTSKLRKNKKKYVIDVTTKEEDSNSDSDVCGDLEQGKKGRKKPKLAKHNSLCCTVNGCGKSLSSETNLKMHMLTVHDIEPKDSKVFRCEFCVKAFLYKFHFNTHMAAQHGGPKRYLCDQCGNNFSQVGLLKAHRLSKHGLGKGKHKCQVCESTFSAKYIMERHMFNAHGVRKDLMCEVCGKTFQSEANLKLHKETHSQQLNFKCDQCQKGFNRKPYLLRHIRETHAEKVTCRICCDGKLYAPSSIANHNRLVHSKLPSGPKTYTCEIADCGKVFNKQYNMRQHMKRHTCIPGSSFTVGML